MKIDIEKLAKEAFINEYCGRGFTSDELYTYISAYEEGFKAGYNIFASKYVRYNSSTMLHNLFITLTELDKKSGKIPVEVFEIINNFCVIASKEYPKDGDYNGKEKY